MQVATVPANLQTAHPIHVEKLLGTKQKAPCRILGPLTGTAPWATCHWVAEAANDIVPVRASLCTVYMHT